jgi:hypothetical protein
MAEAIGSRKRVSSGPFVASGQRPTQVLVVSFPPDRRNYADMMSTPPAADRPTLARNLAASSAPKRNL